MAHGANKTDISDGKPRALITGGARRVGAYLTEKLARNGYDLVLHYHHSQAEAEALKVSLSALGADVILRQADLTDHAAIKGIWADLPRVDVLINNASIFERDTLKNMRAADLSQHLAVNVSAPLLMSQAFMAQLPEGAKGNIVMMGDSGFGWSLSREFFSYAASKLALSASTDLLASACAPHVRVNTLALGPTLEGLQDSAESFARIAAITPLARTSDLEDIWRALEMVLNNPSLTGQVISLAGGLHLATHRRI